jgi:hypothetical protein
MFEKELHKTLLDVLRSQSSSSSSCCSSSKLRFIRNAQKREFENTVPEMSRPVELQQVPKI